MEFLVDAHGAIGNGLNDDTAALQQAIDACHAHGGGRVLLSPGRHYRSGLLWLRSNVELHLPAGTVLQGLDAWSRFVSDIQVTALSSGTINENSGFAGMLIGARDAHNVSISGHGVIDGNGRAFVSSTTAGIHVCPNQRPFTLFFIGCTNVSIVDVTFRDPALWTVRLTGCRRSFIRGITIDADLKMPNSDGIDIDHCQDVIISDCNISCGDDAISLKTCEEFPQYGPTEGVIVSNCILRSTSSALVVGVDAAQDIRNVVFHDCIVRQSHRGLSVNLGQEGNFENITFHNIHVETKIFSPEWWGRGEIIYVSAEPWHDRVGRIRDIRFSDIHGEGENGVYVEGFTPDHVSGIRFERVHVRLRRPRHDDGGQYDRRPTQREGIFPSPTSGFHLHNARHVTLEGCSVQFPDDAPAYFQHALAASNVSDLRLRDFSGSGARPEVPAITVDGEGLDV